MRHTQTITADGDYTLATVQRRAESDSYMATINAAGTWGGGTITWKISFDNGATKNIMKDESATNVTSTADDMFNCNLGNGGTNIDAPIIYASMAGSAGASVVVTLVDNN